jgi:hypothetical protein
LIDYLPLEKQDARTIGYPTTHFAGYGSLLLSIPTFGVTMAMAFSEPAVTTGPDAQLIRQSFARAYWWFCALAYAREAIPAFTTKSILFNPRYMFTTFFQFQMTDHGCGWSR